MSKTKEISDPIQALPFWISLAFVPLVLMAIAVGGAAVWIVPAVTLGLYSVLDVVGGFNTANADPDTPTDRLFWYRLITLIWLPLQMLIVFSALYAATNSGGFTTLERFILMLGVGMITGAVGIVYAHELMHQSNRLERNLGDGLMAMALYGHFRSEHLLVHHLYVGTPRDPVTARYNEGFHRFFPRVLIGCFRSAWRAERAMLARKGAGVWHHSNPFFRYAGLAGAMLLIAAMVGGWAGIGFFVFQALIAVWYLELVNYVEHYGLVRKHLGDGAYEHVKPHHSWNDSHMVTSWLLANLQRHSDHHVKPSRRFPLLQHIGPQEAPQLPVGYIGMTALAMMPPLWRRVMNPRVRKWRAMYYPEITDWKPYKEATNPMPQRAP